MRTIKFRAWSLKDKCYLNSFAIFYNGDFADMAKGVMHNNICQCDINYQKTPDDIIIEQFTGLHDKNGVEIYEGDKLVITQSFQILDGEVIYHEDTACFRLKIDEDEQEVLWYLPKEMEVIGNIHEEVE